MSSPLAEVRFELDGWVLFWAELELLSGGAEALADLRDRVAELARAELAIETLAAHPTAAALRKLFRATGCDPTRYRPSSEALLRRILKGGELPAVHPLVDLNNCLSARLVVPCCVMSAGTFSPPMTLRSGREGESYESLRGPFRLDRKPLLTDAAGPCDAPITGGVRVKVTPTTTRATLVAYLPAGPVEPEQAERELTDLVAAAPVARVLASGSAQRPPT